uniref:F-box domain-containing protein n=1 Tax=Caenorhabditis tropicalis TaxID=1561998 RepID=A0A1I7TUD3_9PELO
MFVDSLLKLSIEKVAECLVKGHYKHLDFSLEAPLSDQVFSEVNKIKEYYEYSPVIAKETGLKLNIKNFNFESIPICGKDFENLHLHDIDSLVIDLDRLYEIDDYDREGTYNIVLILKTCLNERSRQNLRKLALKGYADFEKNWVEKLADLLPNLQSFDHWFDEEEDVLTICRFFPSLIHLNIHDSCNLNEIHRLKNLQSLNMNCSLFESSEGLGRLFELPNLLLLDVSKSDGFFRNLLLCEGTFQNLRFIESSGSDITETQLRRLVDRNPSLETIIVLGTPCQYTDFSDLPVTILNLANFKSTMNTLNYTLNKNKIKKKQVYNSIDRLEALQKNRTVKGFKEDEFLNLMMKVTQKCQPQGAEKNMVAKCLIPYFKRLFPKEPINEVLQNLDPKDPLFIERRWAAQTVLRYFPELARYYLFFPRK